MATRSTLAIIKEDGTVESIYCHNDGSLVGNGYQLYMHYQDPEKIKRMIALGSMSSLSANVEPTMTTHHFNSPEPGVCVFYHRDRGEDLHINHYPSVNDFVSIGQYESCAYLFNEKKGSWYYLNDNNELKPLYGALVKCFKSNAHLERKLQDVLEMKEIIKHNKEKIKLAHSLNKTLENGLKSKQRKI